MMTLSCKTVACLSLLSMTLSTTNVVMQGVDALTLKLNSMRAMYRLLAGALDTGKGGVSTEEFAPALAPVVAPSRGGGSVHMSGPQLKAANAVAGGEDEMEANQMEGFLVNEIPYDADEGALAEKDNFIRFAHQSLANIPPAEMKKLTKNAGRTIEAGESISFDLIVFRNRDDYKEARKLRVTGATSQARAANDAGPEFEVSAFSNGKITWIPIMDPYVTRQLRSLNFETNRSVTYRVDHIIRGGTVTRINYVATLSEDLSNGLVILTLPKDCEDPSRERQIQIAEKRIVVPGIARMSGENEKGHVHLRDRPSNDGIPVSSGEIPYGQEVVVRERRYVTTESGISDGYWLNGYWLLVHRTSDRRIVGWMRSGNSSFHTVGHQVYNIKSAQFWRWVRFQGFYQQTNLRIRPNAASILMSTYVTKGELVLLREREHSGTETKFSKIQYWSPRGNIKDVGYVRSEYVALPPQASAAYPVAYAPCAEDPGGHAPADTLAGAPATAEP